MRLRVGARVTQLPSGCMPMISEWACWEIWRIEGAAVLLRHPVVRLDLLLGVDARLEGGELRRVFGLQRRQVLGVQRLGVHAFPAFVARVGQPISEHVLCINL